MSDEKQLQLDIKLELEKKLWEVKDYVPRQDCVNWEYPYQADLIIRHPCYQKLGWIGLEIKDHHRVADAFHQILTQYQNNYFDKIDQPINIWAIISNSTDHGDFALGRNIEQSVYVEKFGIGHINWNFNKTNIIFNSFNTGSESIYINPIQQNDTDEQLLSDNVINKSKWVKKLNFENIGWIE